MIDTIQLKSLCTYATDTVIMVTNWIDDDLGLLEVVNMPLSSEHRISSDIGVWKIKQIKK